MLETKLHVPRRRRALVARPRLADRLSRAMESTLTLVSAPAGFGKTTLLAQWLANAAADGRSPAWLSLDERDNDPALFWPYVVTALRTAAPGVGADALLLLQSPHSPIESVLASLLNDLGAIAADVVLILDDYHVIEARQVQDAMAFLLERLPAQLHVVIGSRADPALPLARLRARGELVEIRAADLRFTPEEAAAYLDDVMGLALTADDVAALEARTEGWIAALQLAGLSMQGRDDIAGFIAGFAGDDRYIVDYLAEEVLQRQPEQVRNFLLRTSILSRLNGSLCDAVTGRQGGRAMLEALDRGNLFVVALDDRRRWYRYHHLFADVLRTTLLDEQPDAVPGVHRLASGWYERNGEPSEAIRHAIAGQDFARAADLIERATPALRQRRQEATLRGWLEALPDELLRVRPVLSVGYAATLMITGQVEGVEARLRDAERCLAARQQAPSADSVAVGSADSVAVGSADSVAVGSADIVAVDEAALRGLPSAIALYRAGQARVRGDVAGTMTHARRALDLVGADDHLGRGAAAALLGLAYWTSGDLEAGHRWSAEGIASLDKAGHVSDVIGCTMAVAEVHLAQGRLGAAMSAYEWGLRRATEPPGTVLPGAADMHVGMAEVLRERNDLDAATAHLRTSGELGERAGLPQNRYRRRVALALIRQAQGDFGGALDLLAEAERLYVSDFFPDVRPIPALRARVWVAQGRWGEALGWARAQGLSTEDDLSYLREFAHITLARALLARFTVERAEPCVDEAMGLLERLLPAADRGGRTASVIEILVLQALAHQTRGDPGAAVQALRRSLTLAEPEGYIRVFVEEGAPMAAVLRAVAKQGIASGHVRRLLAAIDRTEDSPAVGQGLIEPLSERELDVLRLLGTDLGGPDIARHLVVSLNTVRTHTRNIYAKLGVNNRRAAVRRGEELRLLTRGHDRRTGHGPGTSR